MGQHAQESTINMPVFAEKKFLQHIARSARIMVKVKLVHCYLAGDFFKISYYKGITIYDFSKCKVGIKIISCTGNAIKIIRKKLTNTTLLITV
jgi:hypothetical protein